MNRVFRVQDFEVNKNYVIEASAGTGKTYNIVEMVYKLVKEFKIGLDEILIVTYTDKAAGELKNRIRKKLKGENVDNACIYTIHSFCQTAIKEFGISADLPLNLSIINDEELHKFADRYLREGDILKDITSYSVVNDYTFNFESMKNILCEALKKYYLNSNNEEENSIIKLEEITQDEEELFSMTSDLKKAESISDLFEKYPKIKSNYEKFAHSKEAKALEFALELERCFKENFNFNGNKYKSNTAWSKNDSIKAELKEAFLYFHGLKNSFLKIKPQVYFTKIYLKDFYIKWQKEKELNKYQTFDDMIRYVRESVLIENGPMREKLRAKFRYAIIDEFQDTNQLQFDIFSSVFMCEGHNIIVVGDPKQSIYSFQGADIQVYYTAKKAIEESGGIICELNKNYRSTGAMVDSCNKLFKFYNFDGTDFTDCGYLVEGEGESEHKVLYEGKPVNAFWIADNGNLDEEMFAKIAVEAIVRCCRIDAEGNTKLRIKGKDDKEYRNVSFKDFAVLAKARSEMTIIERKLKLAGIPFVRYKDQNLFNGKECADWIAIFRALSTPDLTGNNRKVFKKALFTNFFGLSIKRISDEIFNTDSSDEIKLIKKWKQLVIERKWEDLIDSIIVDSKIVDKLSSLSGIQSLGIYKQIGNFSIEYLSNNHSMDELIINLQNMANGASGEDAEAGPIVEKATNFDCVQILTMHASKGLQFPVVISVAGFKNPRPDDIYSYHKIDKSGDSHMLGFEENDQVKKEKIEELKRLFYVAYTRAQFIMLLPRYSKYGKNMEFVGETIDEFIQENQSNINFLVESENEVDALTLDVKKILAHTSSATHSKDSDEARISQNLLLKKMIKEIGRKSTYKHSYSSLSHSEKEDEMFDIVDTEGPELEGLAIFDRDSKQIPSNVDEALNCNLLPSNYPCGSRTGTALHEVFEMIDFTDYKNNLSFVIVDAFNNVGISLNEDLINPTINMVDNVLSATLPVIQGNSGVVGQYITLSSLSNENVKKEVEFNFNFNDEVLKNYFNGFIDLIFKNGEYYSILDWKSDNLNDDFTSYADNDELKKHVDECYSIQRVLYSYCLIKWLKSFYINENEEDIFNNHFGGIYYIFIRGCAKGNGNGVYCQTWNSWTELEDAFQNIMRNKIWRAKDE